ncbi:MAG: hypothetical protein F4Y02_07315 [Chloroflexi bacterium]|nr:hypothetical protein [Chloroflexota bacterium]
MLLDGLTTLWVFALMLIGGITLIVLLYRGASAVLSTTAQNWSPSKRLAIQIAATLGTVFLIVLTAAHTLQIYDLQWQVDENARAIESMRELQDSTIRRVDAAEIMAQASVARSNTNEDRTEGMLRMITRLQEAQAR